MNTSEKVKRLAELDLEIDQARRILGVVSDGINHKNEQERLRELYQEREDLDDTPIITIIKVPDEKNVRAELECGQCERTFLRPLDNTTIIKCPTCGHEETMSRVCGEYAKRKKDKEEELDGFINNVRGTWTGEETKEEQK